MFELEELKKVCEDKKITIDQLLEEKVTPLYKKISSSQGELIGALTRNYEQCSHGMIPVHYSLKEILYTGLITPETKFPKKEDLFIEFLSGINKAYSLDLNSYWERDFKECNEKKFRNFKIDRWNLLCFMDRPVEIPKDSWRHSCYGSSTTCPFTKKPRLELYIGDKQTIPFLQKKLEGWRYLQLSEILEYNLPVTDYVTKKIEKEQLEIFDKIKLKESKNSQRKEIMKLLETAIKRGYHETGMQIEKQLDAGIIMKINLKDFFTQRKEMFKL